MWAACALPRGEAPGVASAALSTVTQAHSMRAMLMTAVGGPEVLQLADLPEPEIAAEPDVRVCLRAAGINPVDYKLRSGGTIGGALPAILGWDGAGIVEAVGPAVTRVRTGDEVYFCDGGFGPTPGTYAELKILDE